MDFNEPRDDGVLEWHLHLATERENYTNTSSPNFYRPDYSSCPFTLLVGHCPTNSVKALKAIAKYARIAINKTVKVLV